MASTTKSRVSHRRSKIVSSRSDPETLDTAFQTLVATIERCPLLRKDLARLVSRKKLEKMVVQDGVDDHEKESPNSNMANSKIQILTQSMNNLLKRLNPEQVADFFLSIGKITNSNPQTLNEVVSLMSKPLTADRTSERTSVEMDGTQPKESLWHLSHIKSKEQAQEQLREIFLSDREESNRSVDVRTTKKLQSDLNVLMRELPKEGLAIKTQVLKEGMTLLAFLSEHGATREEILGNGQQEYYANTMDSIQRPSRAKIRQSVLYKTLDTLRASYYDEILGPLFDDILEAILSSKPADPVQDMLLKPWKVDVQILKALNHLVPPETLPPNLKSTRKLVRRCSRNLDLSFRLVFTAADFDLIQKGALIRFSGRLYECQQDGSFLLRRYFHKYVMEAIALRSCPLIRGGAFSFALAKFFKDPQFRVKTLRSLSLPDLPTWLLRLFFDAAESNDGRPFNREELRVFDQLCGWRLEMGDLVGFDHYLRPLRVWLEARTRPLEYLKRFAAARDREANQWVRKDGNSEGSNTSCQELVVHPMKRGILSAHHKSFRSVQSVATKAPGFEEFWRSALQP